MECLEERCSKTTVKQKLKGRLNINKKELGAFCQRNNIKSLALFGSVLRDDFRPDSDVDVLVEFQPGKTPDLFTIADMEEELSPLLDNRKVDLRTPQDISHHFRDKIIREAVALTNDLHLH